MLIRKLAIAALSATALLASAVSVMAQETPPAETPAAETPAAEVPAGAGEAVSNENAANPERNWIKICDPLDSGEQACIMRQVILTNGAFQGSFLLRDDPGQESRLLAVAAVPLGVLLPFGLTWQIDNSPPIRVPYMLCDPQSCATQLVINEQYVNSLKRGNILRLTAKNRQNEDLIIEINLAGFTNVYDSETALTFDQFRQETTGENALEQVLNDRAEELRRQLDGGAPAAEGTPLEPAPQ